jgi:hypothetical protein
MTRVRSTVSGVEIWGSGTLDRTSQGGPHHEAAKCFKTVSSPISLSGKAFINQY